MTYTKLIAIDPGTRESGVCIIDTADYKPLMAGKHSNESLLANLKIPTDRSHLRVAIEMISHYGTGMPAGKEVFDTCVWIGRFTQYFLERGITVETLPRTTVKTPSLRDSTSEGYKRHPGACGPVRPGPWQVRQRDKEGARVVLRIHEGRLAGVCAGCGISRHERRGFLPSLVNHYTGLVRPTLGHWGPRRNGSVPVVGKPSEEEVRFLPVPMMARVWGRHVDSCRTFSRGNSPGPSFSRGFLHE